jgi:hypothetical protein
MQGLKLMISMIKEIFDTIISIKNLLQQTVHLIKEVTEYFLEIKATLDYQDFKQSEPILDKYDAMNKLHISRSTYYRYVKIGLLIPRKIGGKITILNQI